VSRVFNERAELTAHGKGGGLIQRQARTVDVNGLVKVAVAALDRLALLVAAGHLRLAPHLDAVRLGAFAASADAGVNATIALTTLNYTIKFPVNSV
jgi:hypothetical protein